MKDHDTFLKPGTPIVIRLSHFGLKHLMMSPADIIKYMSPGLIVSTANLPDCRAPNRVCYNVFFPPCCIWRHHTFLSEDQFMTLEQYITD